MWQCWSSIIDMDMDMQIKNWMWIQKWNLKMIIGQKPIKPDEMNNKKTSTIWCSIGLSILLRPIYDRSFGCFSSMLYFFPNIIWFVLKKKLHLPIKDYVKFGFRVEKTDEEKQCICIASHMGQIKKHLHFSPFFLFLFWWILVRLTTV